MGRTGHKGSVVGSTHREVGYLRMATQKSARDVKK